MGIDVTRYVTRALNGGDDEIMDRALELRLLPAPGPASWASDRLTLLKHAVFTALRARFKAAAVLGSDQVAYDPNRAESMREHRRQFARIHFDSEIDFVGRGEERVPLGGRGAWLRWYWLGVRAALLALLDVSPRRYAWLGGLLIDVQSVARALPGIDTVYCFGLFDRRPYLMATWLARHTAVTVLPVFQNIPLYRNCRYFHLDTPVVLTSKVNLPEAEYFRSQGIFRSRELIYRSQEFPADTVGLERPEPVYDIGYFSSGEWARKGGLYIADDVEAIRRGDYDGSVYARHADEITRALVEYAKESGRTLRLYPHPYERRLRADHGIEPPWAAYADGDRVTVDWGGENSRAKMFEPTVAVSLQSSLIWERLDHDLDASFIYRFAERDLNVYDPDALGRYAVNTVGSPQELTEKVSAAL